MERKKTVQYVTIDNDRVGQRIDNFLISALGKIPKACVYRWLRKGEVRVNKKRIKQTYRLQESDIVRIPPMFFDEQISEKKLKNYNFSYLEKLIIYEDNDFMILNKPHGLAVHGGTGINIGLIEQLKHIRPNEKKLELVHRLDRDTSGCILIAKKYSILVYFHQQLRDRKIIKNYHALVYGAWLNSNTSINKPLKKFVPKSGERFVRVHPDGKESITTVSVLKRFNNCTLVNASPKTGRTHQLRVHLQSEGHPILGDVKYSREEFDNEFIKFGLKRLFLHANELIFTLPNCNTVRSFTASYDNSLSNMISNLEQECSI